MPGESSFWNHCLSDRLSKSHGTGGERKIKNGLQESREQRVVMAGEMRMFVFNLGTVCLMGP